jgi:hypothetical protein
MTIYRLTFHLMIFGGPPISTGGGESSGDNEDDSGDSEG